MIVSGRIKLCLTLALILSHFSVSGYAQKSTQEKIDNSEVLLIPSDHPMMAKAYAQAKRTLPNFLKSAENIPKTWEFYGVKLKLSDMGGTEFIWVGDFKRNGDTFTGILDNQPIYLATYQKGDPIVFREDDILDWNYLDDKGYWGSFTTCVLLRNKKTFDAEVRIQQLKLDCSWMNES